MLSKENFVDQGKAEAREGIVYGKSLLEGVRIMVDEWGGKVKVRHIQGNSIVLYNDPQHVWGGCTNFGHMSVG